MKILITGTHGFVGRNVKEYLEKDKKYEIYAPLRSELDCTDEESVTLYLEKHRFDYVLNFAFCGGAVEESTCKNMRMFYNFYKNSHLYGKMFYTGSGAEYGKHRGIASVTENEVGTNIPTDSYGILKYSIGKNIESSSNIYNLRIFGLYGKYEYYPTKFISNVCCKAIKDIHLTMRQNVYFDYLWIDDFCRMLELMLHAELKHHTYNMVSGKRISLKEICDIVLEISGKSLPVHICKDGLANEYTASNKRFIEEFPKFTYTPAKQAIEELYHWYEGNVDIDIYKLLY